MEQEEYQQVFEYYKGLIAFRKAHSVLRLDSADAVKNHVTKIDGTDLNVLAMHLTGGVEGETAEEMIVIFNPNEEETEVTLPDGNWNVYINGEKAGTNVLESAAGTAKVTPISAMVLIKEGTVSGEDVSAEESEQTAGVSEKPAEESGVNTILVGVLCTAAVVAVVVLIVLLKKKKQK